MNASTLGYSFIAVVAACTVALACSSDDEKGSPPTSPPATSTAAAVTGAPDTHCVGQPTITTSQAACTAPAEEDDAGDSDGGGATNDYGDTMYNSEGDDDDCKYHVKWQSTAVGVNTDVTFLVSATKKADNAPLTGAATEAEVFLDEETPAPNSGTTTTESAPGTYTIGPVRFNAPGKWTVRFHFFGSCNDNEESPHGHAAFFVDVP